MRGLADLESIRRLTNTTRQRCHFEENFSYACWARAAGGCPTPSRTVRADFPIFSCNPFPPFASQPTHHPPVHSALQAHAQTRPSPLPWPRAHRRRRDVRTSHHDRRGHDHPDLHAVADRHRRPTGTELHGRSASDAHAGEHHGGSANDYDGAWGDCRPSAGGNDGDGGGRAAECDGDVYVELETWSGRKRRRFGRRGLRTELGISDVLQGNVRPVRNGLYI